MDVFNTEESPTTENTQGNEQQQNEAQPQESYLKKLIEVKGENWNDPEVLAKGKLEADNYIKELETQLTQMREDMGKQDYAKELLTQLQNKATYSTNVNTATTQEHNSGAKTDGDTKPEVSEELLKSLVEKTLTEREKENTVKQNLDLVNQKMVDSFGTDAQAHVQKKAQELNMSLERLQELAAESPTAFFTLIGEQSPKSSQPIIQGSVRTEGVNMQKPAERNFQYYQNLRRQNKALYYSPKVQQQMFDDRVRLGEKWNG